MRCWNARVAIDAIAENAQDTPPLRTGALDVLAQHVLGRACGEPFLSDELYAEVLTSAPYAVLTRTDFDDVVDFVATGGYALKTYERFARIKQDKQGRWRVTNPRVRQSYRLNVGTIVEEPMLKVRLVRARGGGSGSTGALGRGGRMLGEIEEYFIEGLVVGDTFVFGGEVVRYEALAEDQVYVSRANDKDAKVPSYMGGKFPLSTYLAERVRNLLDDRRPGMRCRSRCATGCRCRSIFRACRRCANCWSKPFPAATSITWSAIPSRDGWRTRRLACS